jgi:hypothetical protein
MKVMTVLIDAIADEPDDVNAAAAYHTLAAVLSEGTGLKMPRTRENAIGILIYKSAAAILQQSTEPGSEARCHRKHSKGKSDDCCPSDRFSKRQLSSSDRLGNRELLSKPTPAILLRLRQRL